MYMRSNSQVHICLQVEPNIQLQQQQTIQNLLILYILNHIAKYLTVWSLPRQPWELMYGIP